MAELFILLLKRAGYHPAQLAVKDDGYWVLFEEMDLPQKIKKGFEEALINYLQKKYTGGNFYGYMMVVKKFYSESRDRILNDLCSQNGINPIQRTDGVIIRDDRHAGMFGNTRTFLSLILKKGYNMRRYESYAYYFLEDSLNYPLVRYLPQQVVNIVLPYFIKLLLRNIPEEEFSYEAYLKQGLKNITNLLETARKLSLVDKIVPVFRKQVQFLNKRGIVKELVSLAEKYFKDEELLSVLEEVLDLQLKFMAIQYAIAILIAVPSKEYGRMMEVLADTSKTLFKHALKEVLDGLKRDPSWEELWGLLEEFNYSSPPVFIQVVMSRVVKGKFATKEDSIDLASKLNQYLKQAKGYDTLGMLELFKDKKYDSSNILRDLISEDETGRKIIESCGKWNYRMAYVCLHIMLDIKHGVQMYEVTNPVEGLVIKETDGNGLTIRSLGSDFMGKIYHNYIGKFTRCCQNIGDAGEDIVKYTCISDTSTVWVVEDKNSIIAEAAVWLYKEENGDDVLVVDNIEGLMNTTMQRRVMELFSKVIETLPYKRVVMGLNYSKVKDVLEEERILPLEQAGVPNIRYAIGSHVVYSDVGSMVYLFKPLSSSEEEEEGEK